MCPGHHGGMSEQPDTGTQRPPGHCPALQDVLELVGGRWTGSILLAVLSGRRRFSDIRTAVPGVSDRLLCDRLRRLEAEGLVTRHDEPDQTPVGYVPTPAAQELLPTLHALSEWTNRWKGGSKDQEPRTAPPPPPPSTASERNPVRPRPRPSSGDHASHA